MRVCPVPGAQTWTLHSLCGLTGAEQWGRISAWPCCCACTVAAWSARDALLPRCTAASWELAAPQGLFCRAASTQSAPACPAAGVTPFRGFGELHEVPFSPLIQPLQIPVNNNTALQPTVHSPQSGAPKWLAGSAFCPIMQVMRVLNCFGPSISSCRMPLLTSHYLDFATMPSALWTHLSRDFSFHLAITIPRLDVPMATMNLWVIMSKAFLKSRPATCTAVPYMFCQSPHHRSWSGLHLVDFHEHRGIVANMSVFQNEGLIAPWVSKAMPG